MLCVPRFIVRNRETLFGAVYIVCAPRFIVPKYVWRLPLSDSTMSLKNLRSFRSRESIQNWCSLLGFSWKLRIVFPLSCRSTNAAKNLALAYQFTSLSTYISLSLFSRLLLPCISPIVHSTGSFELIQYPPGSPATSFLTLALSYGSFPL